MIIRNGHCTLHSTFETQAEVVNNYVLTDWPGHCLKNLKVNPFSPLYVLNTRSTHSGIYILPHTKQATLQNIHQWRNYTAHYDQHKHTSITYYVKTSLLPVMAETVFATCFN
jgi:hypothetical protein